MFFAIMFLIGTFRSRLYLQLEIAGLQSARRRLSGERL